MPNNNQNSPQINWGGLNKSLDRVVSNGIAALKREAADAAKQAADDFFGSDPPLRRNGARVRANSAAPERIVEVFEQTEPAGTSEDTDDLTDLDDSAVMASQLFVPSPPSVTKEDCLAFAVAFYRLFSSPTDDDDGDDGDDEESSAQRAAPMFGDAEAADDEGDDKESDDEEGGAGDEWIVAWNAKTGEAFCGTGDDLIDHCQKAVQSMDDWGYYDDQDEIMALPCDTEALRHVLDCFDQVDMDPAVEHYMSAHDGDKPPILQHLHIDGVQAPLALFGVARGIQYSAKKEGKMTRYSHTCGERTGTFPYLYHLNSTTAVLHNPAGLFDKEGKWLDD